jgi:hypothetical protein
MSDAPREQDTPHEGPIKTPRQLVAAVTFAFVVPVIVIVLLASYVATDTRPAAGSDLLSREAVAERLQPVGRVELRDASSPATLRTGEQVFSAQCLPHRGRGRRTQGRRRRRLGAAHQDRLRGLAQCGAEGQERDGPAGRWRVRRGRDRPRRRLHGEQEWREVRRAEGPGSGSLGARRCGGSVEAGACAGFLHRPGGTGVNR